MLSSLHVPYLTEHGVSLQLLAQDEPPLAPELELGLSEEAGRTLGHLPALEAERPLEAVLGHDRSQVGVEDLPVDLLQAHHVGVVPADLLDEEL